MRAETRELWSKRVTRWKESGLSAGEYAREVGLNASTLSYWKWRLNKEATRESRSKQSKAKVVRRTSEPVSFVEVPSRPSGLLGVAGDSGLELAVGGRHVVRVGSHFDAETLGRLLDVVERRT